MNLLDLHGPLQLTTNITPQPDIPLADFLRSGIGRSDAGRDVDLDDMAKHPISDRKFGPTIGFQSHATSEPAEIAVARDLVRRRYAWRGYRVSETQDSAFPDKHRAPHYVTIVAKSCNATVGTVTLGMDSTHGLLVDEANKREADRLRTRGRRLCELVRLAVEDGVNSKAVLASLFQCAYTIGRCVHGLTDVLIEVNPRHVCFYRKVFGFICASEEKICERVGAISVLLSLDISSLEGRFFLPTKAAA